jgi:hypothetical protein
MTTDIDAFIELYAKVKGGKITPRERQRLMKEKEKSDRLFELFKDTCNSFKIEIGDVKSLLVWDFLSALTDGNLYKAYAIREHLKLLSNIK